jgi:hypothetical protein
MDQNGSAFPPEFASRAMARANSSRDVGAAGVSRRLAPQTGRRLGMPTARRAVASQSYLSWNQIASFLESMRQLRDSTGFAA